MKIAIIAIGTRGDIQPCVALAIELKKMNADVFVATFKEYKNLVVSNDVDFKEIPNNPDVINKNLKKNKNDKSTKLETFLRTWLSKSLEICFNSNIDALIYTPPFIVGSHLAEKVKVPFFPVIFEPIIKTKDFPSPHQPILNKKFELFNKFSYLLTDYLFWNRMKDKINKLRKDILDLPPLTTNPYKNLVKNKVPYIACYSRTLVPKPADWYDEINVNGYWFLESNKQVENENKLTEYLENGEAPIFIDFGSFSNKRIQKQLNYIIKDLVESKERVLIDIGKLDIKNLQLPPNSFILKKNVSHEWLLPKVKAIIMHSGVGVTHAALKAGIPSIPVPIIGTQYFWAEKLYKLGLSSKPIRLRKLKQGDLLNAINYLNEKKDIFINVKRISKNIKNENGSNKTVEFIISYLKKMKLD